MQQDTELDFERGEEVEPESSSILKKVADIMFTIFVFFVFFNTYLPFQQKVTDIEVIETSNPVNQIVYGSLLVISVFFNNLKKKRSHQNYQN